MNADSLFRESLKIAGDPHLAESQWETLRPHVSDSIGKAGDLRFLFVLLGNSRFLVQRLSHSADPGKAVDALVRSPYLLKPKSVEEMFEELLRRHQREFQGDTASAQKLLRHYKYEEMTRIAARDLSGLVPFEEIGRELAALAAASTEVAIRSAAEIVRNSEKGSVAAAKVPFAVLAFGKFGGEDLNFSSDIDILYVHGRPPVPDGGDRSVFEHFCRVSETVTRLLHERTEDGFVFRVDLDLRPEGKSGVIVNSIDALTSYYENSGAPWERAALTKARPAAGDTVFGLEVLNQLTPFVFPKHIDTGSIDALKEIKGKIDAELKKSKSGGFHVKLGLGGIREIEFFVTAFQLIYGGKDPALRERNTLRALTLLRERGLVPEEDATRLQDAYVFLRRIENRLQMEEERQTHRVPTEPVHLLALARRMGFADQASFERALSEKTGFAADCFERLAS